MSRSLYQIAAILVLGLPTLIDAQTTIYVPGGTVGVSSNGNVGVGRSTPEAMLHVEGQIAGGFGAYTTGGVADWNHISNSRSGNGYTLLLGSAVNGPGPNYHFHPFNFEYGNKDGSGSITQLAIPYSADGAIGQGIWMRGRYWSDPWGPWVRIISENTEGNVGIGTTSPTGALQIVSSDVGSLKSYSVNNGFGLILDQYYSAASEAGGSFTRTADFVASTGDTSSSQIRFLTKPAGADPVARMILSSTGNVGIAITSPTHKLAVNGTIRAKDIIVDTGWADYVFDDDYVLTPLTEVEAHIKQHRRLPGIPSAAEVSEQGVNIGEMQAKLLAKVEELTLHVITQEKRSDAQQTEIAALRAENAEFRQQLSAILP